MFCVIYKFNVIRSKEAQFIDAWSKMTKYIIDNHGGLGSRLHKDSLGDFIAYAQWPSQEAWVACKLDSQSALALISLMRECYVENAQVQVLHKLDLISDLFVK